MRTQINNFDAGRGYAYQIDRNPPAPDDTESSITPSKLLILGVFIGCLAAAGVCLCFLMAGSSPYISKPQTSAQGVAVIPEASGIIQSTESETQPQVKGRINKPRTDRSRSAQRTSGQNDYKNATVVTAPGHTPKMLESQ